MSAHSFTEWLAHKRITSLALRTFATGLVLLLLTGCGSSEPDVKTEALPKKSQAAVRTYVHPRERQAKRHQKARHAAWAWLDKLEIDPVALGARGVRGKKKLGEVIGAYLYLLRYLADPIERSRISHRLSELEERRDPRATGPRGWSRPVRHDRYDTLACSRRKVTSPSFGASISRA